MKTNSEIFCKAYRMVYGEYLDNVKQLKQITFIDEDVEDCLIVICENYHQIKKEEESFTVSGEAQFNQLELAFYKWTNPFFWIWVVVYGCYVLVKSFFVSSKDFKDVKK